MSIAAQPEPAFAPRASTDPEPDLTGYCVAHRAMTRDLRRLAALVHGVAVRRDEAWLDAHRAYALGRYASDLLAEVQRHHRGEDRVLWPLLRALAGPRVRLDGLADDHGVLEPLAGEARTAVQELASTPYDTATAWHAARTTAALRDVVAEHVAEEERDVFPLISRYVPVEALAWAEDRMRRETPLAELAFVVPWLASAADDGERARSRTCRAHRMVLAATRTRHARRERVVFG
jgi:hemerythrin-like domain-containing protein